MLALIIATASLAAATPAEAVDQLVVAKGQTMRADSITTGDLVVEGLLLSMPGSDLTIYAQSVTVRAGGVIVGASGTPGDGASATDATGAPGASGSSVWIEADSLTVEPGGFVLGGVGGYGGTALALVTATD